MKKFIYSLNILLLVLIPTTIFISRNDNTIHYQTDTSTESKMIKTTILIDRSTKKKEEQEAVIAQKLAQEEEQKKQEELERQAELKKQRELEEAQKREEAKKVVQPVKVQEEVGSLASSSTSNNTSNIGNTVNVTANQDKRVFVGAKFYEKQMSSYGTDCCSTNPDNWGLTASGFKLQYKNTSFDAGSYGNVRILASDHAGQLDFPLCTIVKIKDPIDGEYNAIILDRGDSNIGLDSRFIFDLVVETNSFAKYTYGVHKNIEVEVLKLGTKSDLTKVRNEGHL